MQSYPFGEDKEPDKRGVHPVNKIGDKTVLRWVFWLGLVSVLGLLAVSAKYLQGYVNAYAFRWNHRDDEVPMFRQILSRLPSLAKDV